MSRLKPHADYLILKPDPDGVQKIGRIFVDTNVASDLLIGTVVEAGPGKLLYDGSYADLTFTEGMKVVYPKYATEIKLHNTKFHIVVAAEILSELIEEEGDDAKE